MARGRSCETRSWVGWVCVLASLVGACARTHERGVEVSPADGGDVAEAGPAASFAVASGPDAGPEVATPSGRCPVGMKLVVGEYCHFLRHRCRVGRGPKAGEYCPEGCDFDPTECQEWVPGSAWCQGSKPIVENGAVVRWVPEYTHVEVCMDEHEWPNRIGAVPAVFMSYFDADALCASVGKRLCTSAEFTLACEGPERRPTATGHRIDGTKCNVDRTPKPGRHPDKAHPEGLEAVDQREPSGSRPACVSPFGIYDLTGNVDEWTTLASVDKHMSGHPSQLKGGYYARGAHPFCRAHTDLHPPTFDFYQIGTRCCAPPGPP